MLGFPLDHSSNPTCCRVLVFSLLSSGEMLSLPMIESRTDSMDRDGLKEPTDEERDSLSQLVFVWCVLDDSGMRN